MKRIETVVEITGRKQDSQTITCAVYPAVGPQWAQVPAQPCLAIREEDKVVLENAFLRAEISAQGVILSVFNKVAGKRHHLRDDQVGFDVIRRENHIDRWLATASTHRHFTIDLHGGPDRATAVFADHEGAVKVSIVYELAAHHFWIERRLRVESSGQPIVFDSLTYGKLEMADVRDAEMEELAEMPTMIPVEPTILNLGRFDRPRLAFAPKAAGGLFAGVGWWFYSVTERGVYRNADMDFAVEGSFESEPWYVGIALQEPGDPFPGWLWYKNFLEQRKKEHEKHSSLRLWNCGWMMTRFDGDHPQLPAAIAVARKLGFDVITLGDDPGDEVLAGSGCYHTQARYLKLTRESEVAKANVLEASKNGIALGLLDDCRKAEQWSDPVLMRQRLDLLDACIEAGYKSCQVDFFATRDTFKSHYNVAAYLRTMHAKADYTTCDLGMALYGPQFQREVLCNHAGDIEDYAIDTFSIAWAEWLAFRANRRACMRKYGYIVPEAGLYYGVTPYRNPIVAQKKYRDPEPQTFIRQGTSGMNFNFNDVLGVQRTLVASAAFSPFLAFGYLDLRSSEQHLAIVRRTLDWLDGNREALRPARVCYEDEDCCVVSKIAGERGLVFLINYAAGRRKVALRLQTKIAGPLTVQKVYPVREAPFTAHDGETLTCDLPSESLIILNINEALRSLPPEDAGERAIDLPDWQSSGYDLTTSFVLPVARKDLANATPGLPGELVSTDIWGKVICPQPAVFGKSGATGETGKLYQLFIKTFAFREDKYAATWKFAPWAYGDRVWLVWRPGQAVRLGDGFPTVRLNDSVVELIPRIDCRYPKIANIPEQDWLCPLFFADITAVCLWASKNDLAVAELQAGTKGAWSVRYVRK